jgi:RNA polymerase sigma-32 factor
MPKSASLPVFSAEAGLSKYLAEIRRFPLLEPEQEHMLAKRWREQGDRAAAETLVTSHLRLVARIATGYRGYGLPIGEVIAEGNFGLMQAVKRFDPAKGFRLTTYAIWWIKASIQEYVLRSWSMVKIGASANQRRLFFKLRTAKSRIAAFEEGDLRPDHIEEIAQQLHVPAQDVVEMNRRLSGDVSLNVAVGQGRRRRRMAGLAGRRGAEPRAGVGADAGTRWPAQRARCGTEGAHFRPRAAYLRGAAVGR